jgi:hypothetical protein
MSQDEIKRNIGRRVVINGNRDLAIRGELRPLINEPALDIRIEKLTKSGMAYLKHGKQFYSVPTGNVDLLDDLHEKFLERQDIIKEYTKYTEE